VLTLFAFAAISAFASSAPVSENIRVDFDPQKTAIKFSLADFMHDVHGQFHLKSGSLQIDRQSGAASGSLIVDAGSGDSGSGSRDSKMKHDILDAARFPGDRISAEERYRHGARAGIRTDSGAGSVSDSRYRP
jgi:polyisoprenoid-binding protein YceI